jgi:3-methyladenine DNA glycosylase/8-oxoguanine DNA glycosylase
VGDAGGRRDLTLVRYARPVSVTSHTERDDDVELVTVPPVDLSASLRSHRIGPRDPGVDAGPSHYGVAFRFQGAPVVLTLRPRSRTEIEVRLEGEGAEAVRPLVPAICGALDEPDAILPLTAALPRLHSLCRRQRLVRLPRVPWLFEMALGTVLQQRVDFGSAAASYRELSLRHGERALRGLLLVPTAAKLASLPSFAYREANIDGQRERTIRALAAAAPALEALVAAPARAREVLEAIAGFGPWTVASLLGWGLGDADAVPTGDYWLPHVVSNAMIGKARSSDEEMLRLLEPYRPQRFRLVLVLYASGFGAQRFGPHRRRTRIA